MPRYGARMLGRAATPAVAMSDWVKLHRQIQDSPYYTNSVAMHVWLECLLRAAHAAHELYIRREKITLQAGQFVMGRDEFAASIGVSPSTAWFWLLRFESDSMVDIRKTTKGSIVSVKNWSTYQGVDIKVDNRKTADEQQKDTNKKVKNHESDMFSVSNPDSVDCANAQKNEPTPKEYAASFFARDPVVMHLEASFFLGKGAPIEIVRQEFAKFCGYWTERTPGGKKQRWETERTFEVRRRLVTWFTNAAERHQKKGGSLTIPEGL